MKVKEFFKSLIIAVLIVSMLGMTAVLIRSSFANGGTEKVDMSFSSVLSMLGLGFLSDAISKNNAAEFSDYDFSSKLYPAYVALNDESGVRVSVADSDTISAFSALLPSMCAALRAPLEESDENFAAVSRAKGALAVFAYPLSANLMAKLFDFTLPEEDIKIKAAFFDGGKIYFWSTDTTFVSDTPSMPFSVSDDGFVPAEFISDTVDGCIGVLPQDSSVFGQLLLSRPVYSRSKKLFDDAKISMIANLFNFSSSAMIRSIDDGGNLTYVGNLSALSISVSSVLHYYSTQFGGGISVARILGDTNATEFSQRAVCTAAAAFLKELSPYVGEARISNVYMQDGGEYVIEFQFAFNGLSLIPENMENAAVFKYKNGFFTDVSVNLTKAYSSVTQYTMESVFSVAPFVNAENTALIYAAYAEAGSSTRPSLYILQK